MKKRSMLAVAAALALSSSAAFAASSAQDAAAEAASAAPVAVKSSSVQSPAHREAQEKTAKQQVSAQNYVEAPEEFEIASLRRAETTPSYRLFKGDTINILAVGFPDGIGVNNITVGIDGYVQLPYVGSVKMEGLTLDEAKEVLMESLGEYLRIPDMSLLITSYGSRKVYVMGNVASPGIHDLSIDRMNAYAALASAGGWTDRARSTRIQVIRVHDDMMYYRTLNMKDYTKKHDLTQNVVLEDGDILYVPASNGIKFTEDVLPYVNVWALYRSLTK
nr:polysaccharide biosynthesis/export family protein [uncultured Selenomonas sp.]